MQKVATHSLRKENVKMIKGLVRTTIRIDNNLKTRIELLAIKNNLSFNRMLTYILDIGYNTYMENFDKYYERQNEIIKKELKENHLNDEYEEVDN